MFIGLIYRLRELGVPVGISEAVTLGQALMLGIHQQTVTGYYHTARSVLVHREAHLDAFDRAFLAEYAGLTDAQVTEQLREWLDEARREAQIPPDQQDPPTAEQVEQWRRLFEQRLAEQTSRHTGGNHWIGTGGTSPHGQAGQAAAGLSTGSSGGGRAAIRIADARAYRGYRSDITLDIRQFEVALRRLRTFVREGALSELDIDLTIDATARNAGDIEVVTRPPRRPDTHVLLLIDVGGSMYPYSSLISHLFSATKKATHFKELRTYYFHNCPYGKVYETDHFADPVALRDLMRRFDPKYKLILVGDALMADYELHMRARTSATDHVGTSGLEWLRVLRDHFDQSVWLNPEPPGRWRGTTIEQIAEVFQMFPMTVEGLTDAMAALNRGIRA